MKLYRAGALVKKSLMLTFRDFHRFTDLIYWPALDIIVWGFTSKWVQTTQLQSSQVAPTVLCCLVLWQVFYRAQMEVCFTLMDELWSQNFANLFSSPLKISEWIISVIIISFFKSIFTFSFGSLLIYLLYGVNIFQLGFMLLLYFPLIVMSGWVIGFISSSIIIYWGQKLQNLIWVLGWLFVPFSGVFYPIAILPPSLQYISWLLPMPYVFESVRLFITFGKVNYSLLAIGVMITVTYVILAVIMFRFFFVRSKIYGLARLERYE